MPVDRERHPCGLSEPAHLPFRSGSAKKLAQDQEPEQPGHAADRGRDLLRNAENEHTLDWVSSGGLLAPNLPPMQPNAGWSSGGTSVELSVRPSIVPGFDVDVYIFSMTLGRTG